MIEDALLNYGVAGIFILYLIYDRQVILAKVMSSITKNTEVLERLCNKR